MSAKTAWQRQKAVGNPIDRRARGLSVYVKLSFTGEQTSQTPFLALRKTFNGD